jgi:AcrR family transcriptional regulator
VLVEAGYSGLTYEAVATRAATSRAVLYRRWPQRQLLLEAALRRAWTPLDLPDTGELRGDALALLHAINATRAQLITVLMQQLADYYRETGNTLTDLRRIIGMSDRPDPFGSLVARAVERGEIAAIPSCERIMPLDLLRHDLLMRGRPDSADALVDIIDNVWLPLLSLDTSQDSPAPADPNRTGCCGGSQVVEFVDPNRAHVVEGHPLGVEFIGTMPQVASSQVGHPTFLRDELPCSSRLSLQCCDTVAYELAELTEDVQLFGRRVVDENRPDVLDVGLGGRRDLLAPPRCQGRHHAALIGRAGFAHHETTALHAAEVLGESTLLPPERLTRSSTTRSTS